MKQILIFLVVLLLVASLGIGLWYGTTQLPHNPQSASSVKPSPTTPSASAEIIFPRGNETLVTGQTYQLQWQPGSGKIQIFLISAALEPQGSSVSIVDHAYNIDNSGTYSYTIPQNISEGKYKFEIGNLMSNYFEIHSPTISECAPADLQARITTEPAAGNIYGTLSLKNISPTTCTIAGNQFIQAKANAQNVTISHSGVIGATHISLEPNHIMYSQVHYPNGPQCSGPTVQSSITFSYALSANNTVTFSNSTGSTNQVIQTCSATNEKTTVDVWSIYDHPVNQ